MGSPLAATGFEHKIKSEYPFEYGDHEGADVAVGDMRSVRVHLWLKHGVVRLGVVDAALIWLLQMWACCLYYGCHLPACNDGHSGVSGYEFRKMLRSWMWV